MSLTIQMTANTIWVCTCRSFETQLSRVEAELLRREAPPSYGQLIAQGLIPPVEDFPVCSGNQVLNIKMGKKRTVCELVLKIFYIC